MRKRTDQNMPMRMPISTEKTGEAVPMRTPMRFTAAGEAAPLRFTEPGEGDRGYLVSARVGKGKGISR